MSLQQTSSLVLGFGFQFSDLYDRAALGRLDARFLAFLAEADASLGQRLESARADRSALAAKDQSQLILDLAPYLEDFIARLFSIESETKALAARHHSLAPLYSAKRNFVQRKAINRIKPEEAAAYDTAGLEAALVAAIGAGFTELSSFELLYAEKVEGWLKDESANAAALTTAAQYAAWAYHTPEGRARHAAGILFKAPHKVDPMHLVHIETVPARVLAGEASVIRKPEYEWRHRDGFALTDEGMDLTAAADHAHYCIKCHNQGKDSCSHGLPEKATPEKPKPGFQHSFFGIPLAGCPLDEKISEMNVLKGAGITIGALATVTIDNPMAAGTGHRICNDCMKACIFQKQEPVDIPQVETRSLKDVLDLPYGFEIYSLLTRWNPLNFDRPLPRPSTGKKVLVVGLGPAGFTLAHHLMNDGHTVVAIDGLKIEPLPSEISGVDPLGNRTLFQPIKDVNQLYESLSDRVLAGFGGVAEYGITVRWNKNYLKLIRLLIERRSEFVMFGGIRFGGTITVDSAFEMGFDHVALCMGAGKPTVIPMENGLARGVRQASDFLMALQLTGAAKYDTIANLQLRLPVVVIGGGLTAIDTATESMAYYVVQVEKFLARFEMLSAELGEGAVRASWTAEEAEVANEFLTHGRAIREERNQARAEQRAPRFEKLINEWGGVTLAYRRRLVDSPSYTLNHEEVAKALEEGINFAEGLQPEAVEIDQYGHASAFVARKLEWVETAAKLVDTGKNVTLPARAILVAAGTQPNTVLAREDGQILLDGKYFQALDEQGAHVKPERTAKPSVVRVLSHIRPDGRAVSYFGDLHPSFSGNVVKAMGSAKQGYPVVSRMLARLPASGSPEQLFTKLNSELRATVHDVVRLTSNIVEVIVKAPMAARAFLPGQFYRLQNFEALAPKVSVNGNGRSTILAMEGLALTGAKTFPEEGLLSTIVLEMGGSSDLCITLKKGEPVILMGPTGTPTETPERETVLLVGGGLGNAVLFSIGQRLREQGSKVIYFAGYKKLADRYKVEEIEAAADIVVWCCDEAPGFSPQRPQDLTATGNIIECMVAYAQGRLGGLSINLSDVDRIIAIGSDGMMRAVAQARHTVLQKFLKHDHEAIGSINSPMQCMMKEICAQCLQRHVDPKTGEETVVFSCFNQDQKLDNVDFANLRSRLAQNGVQEKLTKLWIDRSLKQLGVRA